MWRYNKKNNLFKSLLTNDASKKEPKKLSKTFLYSSMYINKNNFSCLSFLPILGSYDGTVETDEIQQHMDNLDYKNFSKL